MAFDPQWTVGWLLSELQTVAHRNNYGVRVVRINQRPTPWSAMKLPESAHVIPVSVSCQLLGPVSLSKLSEILNGSIPSYVSQVHDRRFFHRSKPVQHDEVIRSA